MKKRKSPNQALYDRLAEIAALAWVAQKAKCKARTSILKRIENLADVCMVDILNRSRVIPMAPLSFGDRPFDDLDIPF